MPTAMKKDGYRFFFYSNEGNEPPHIHVEKAEAYAKYWLESDEFASSNGFTNSQLRKVRNLIITNKDLLHESWHAHFK